MQPLGPLHQGLAAGLQRTCHLRSHVANHSESKDFSLSVLHKYILEYYRPAAVPGKEAGTRLQLVIPYVTRQEVYM